MSASSPVVRATAPAKVNLVLEVLGRRADGYHELWTWMLAVGLEDEVRVRALPPRAEPGIQLSITGPAGTADVRADASNLVWRAARAVLDRAGTGAGLAIELEKRIPSQSGLGGASADAAATVLAAERALRCALTAEERAAVLASLGSDCAFFAAAPAGVALCGGRGEEIRSAPERAPAWWIAIVAPTVGCPTPAVYAELARRLSRPVEAPSLPDAWLEAPASDARRFLGNRLEAAALAVAPELARWRALFDALGAEHTRLTGSGSAFFALFDERDEAEEFGARVEARARSEGLLLRGRWTVRAAGSGAKVRES
ncbi:MAG: 4-(cytidine 5'-diphospho)-2-C-methyl-D-erythritol kinase [Planctomycetes bacterium]|nr:4-(cytidine 5'-diphospho)-2-C-methyl-D-erythritol kinase [Planctomycetota bacterium]